MRFKSLSLRSSIRTTALPKGLLISPSVEKHTQPTAHWNNQHKFVYKTELFEWNCLFSIFIEHKKRKRNFLSLKNIKQFWCKVFIPFIWVALVDNRILETVRFRRRSIRLPSNWFDYRKDDQHTIFIETKNKYKMVIIYLINVQCRDQPAIIIIINYN